MLRQYDICVFSWPVHAQGKARLAGNGRALAKSRNAALGVNRPTLRASLWCFATALQGLARVAAIPGALRLAAKHHREAEAVNIVLTVH
ncbi:hypothetical protein [Marinobacter fonticola]|uniref:hypothetical protein n=1 Tax=Marinobacter fonticola TaxID=2603215 RepID=UPI0011E67E67|nr:hypothetical protein [Marinobacter fonticola]